MIKAPYLVTPGVAAKVAPELQRILWHRIDHAPIVRTEPLQIILSRSCLRGMHAQWIGLRQEGGGYESEHTLLFPAPVEHMLLAAFGKPCPVICLLEEFEED